MKSVTLSLTVVVAVLFFATANAEPIKWAGNGHYYELQDSCTTDWFGWNSYAASQTFMGTQGYLATITSADENLWITNNFDFSSNAYGCFFGAYQQPNSQEPDGGWTWITGEEWNYTNWGGLNNSLGIEDVLMRHDTKNADGWTWNDYPSTYPSDCALIEYSVVPEPSTIALLASSLAALFLRRKN